MRLCTDWIGSPSRRLTATRTALPPRTSPYCAARQQLQTLRRSPTARVERWQMCWTGYRIGCQAIVMTTTRDCLGVNLRDVLITLGLYPDPGAVVGSEGSGVVLEVAEDVLGFAPGDRAMGLFYGAGPVVVADHRSIAHVPSGWSYAQAATVPAA